MNKRWLWIVLTLISCLGFAAGAYAAGDDQPKYKTYLGITPKDGPSGVVLAAVVAGSPAAQAGLAVGDVILAVNGQKVNNVKDLSETIIPTLVPYTPATIIYQRSGARAETTIVPTGTLRLTVKDLPPRKFVIPGVPDNLPGPRSAVEALDQNNVLKQVIIDPKTGSVVVIGSYDESYATGPISYLDLLKTALQYPYPNFSLVPTPESLANAKKRDYTASQQTMSVQQLILGHPDLEWDRQHLISAYAQEYGVPREDYISLLNYFGFDNRTGDVPPSIARVQEKILRNAGYDEAADAYVLLLSAVPDAAKQALRRLGKAEGDYPGSLPVQVYFTIQEKLQNQPIQWAINKREEVARLDQTQLMIRLQAGLLPAWDKARQNHILAKVLNKMVLSDEATRIAVNNHKPYEAELMYMSVDPTSQLSRILYEADYALKSRNAFPELFANIPGSMNVFEYMASIGAGDLPKFHNGVRTWLEPRQVEMEFSPNRMVVTFGSATVRVIEEFHDVEAKQDLTFPDDPAPNTNWDKWTAQFNNNYDAYARVMPSFHKLREAAKVIALARWITAEHIPVDLSGVAQEKWVGPRTVPGFHYAGFTLQQSPVGSGVVFRTWPKITGGVKFKSKHNWTTYTPAPQSETHVIGQLSLSAGLGKVAVQAAQSGNLEQAKYLAELSAQAMNGSMTKNDLAKLNITVPEPKLEAVAPANVQLQKEMIKKTSQQITALSQDSPAKPTASTALAQLGSLYAQIENNPVAASDYLIKLQTGQLPVDQNPKTPPAATDKQPLVGSCIGGKIGKQDMTPERREYLTKRLQETRDNLKYIEEALRRIAELNAKDVKQLEELNRDISAAYDKAVDRIGDVALDALFDAKMWKDQKAFEKTTAQYEDDLKKIDDTIKNLQNNKTKPLSPEAIRQVDADLKALSEFKNRLQDAYAQVKRMYFWGEHGGKGLMYSKGVASVAEEDDFLERAKQGFIGAVGIALDHPGLENVWKGLEFFSKARFDVVSGSWTYGQYMVDYGIDILSQRYAWGPLSEQLIANIEANRKAVLELREKAAKNRAEAECLENLLK